MTKFFATVCLPPTAPRDVPQAVASGMAPYDVNLADDWNPDGEWDWWMIHANVGQAYLVRPVHDGDPRLLTPATVPPDLAELGALGPLECFGGPRGLLDFEAMRRRAARTHDARLAAWTALAGAHPPARPLADFLARHEADPDGYSVADAEREHLLQPLVQEVARRAVAGDPHFGTSFLLGDPVAYFAREHEEATRSAAQGAVPGSALLTLDGTWTDGRTDVYLSEANRYLDALDPESVVLDVLCHC